jgi:magnesium transporter
MPGDVTPITGPGSSATWASRSTVCAVARTETRWHDVPDLEAFREMDLRAGAEWVMLDATRMDPAELRTVLESHGVHALAAEDAASPRQRPKIERYEDHLFLVLHELDERNGQLEACQVAAILTDHYVLVVHHGAERTVESLRARVARDPDLPPLYLLLDATVDEYEVLANRLEEEVERLEEDALQASGHGRVEEAVEQAELYSIKQKVSRLRRYGLPVERVMAAITGGEAGRSLEESTRHLFQDVHDHTIRLNAQIRNIDELGGAVLDLIQSEQADTLNMINKKLSAWAAIFAAWAVITGFYGMNLDLEPEEQTVFGFWFVLGLLIAVGLALYAVFKRRRWL